MNINSTKQAFNMVKRPTHFFRRYPFLRDLLIGLGIAFLLIILAVATLAIMGVAAPALGVTLGTLAVAFGSVTSLIFSAIGIVALVSLSSGIIGKLIRYFHKDKPSIKPKLPSAEKQANINYILNQSIPIGTLPPDIIKAIGKDLDNESLVRFTKTSRLFQPHLQDEINQRHLEQKFKEFSEEGFVSGLWGMNETYLRRNNTKFLAMIYSNNAYGNSTNSRLNPSDIVQVTSEKSGHKLILLKNGTVFAKGGNEKGQLGLGHTKGQLGWGNNINWVEYHMYTDRLNLIEGLNNVTQVAAGGNNSFFLLNDGTVMACGDYDSTKITTTPTVIQGLNNVIHIAAGINHTLFLLKDGTVMTFGKNDHGQLGMGDQHDRNTPTLIPGLNDVIEISAGGWHSLFLMKDSTVKACGLNTHGQLGVGDHNIRITPVLITTLKGIAQFAAGCAHSLFLTKNGSILGCGENRNRNLGLVDTLDRSIPTLSTINTKLHSKNLIPQSHQRNTMN